MLTTQITQDMVAEYKEIYEKYRNILPPNRKSGSETETYFKEKYNCRIFDSDEFRNVVEMNIMENEFYRNKLPQGILPDVHCYSADGVLVGIDTVSGFFHVECEDIKKAAEIYDDLIVYRGLDEDDLKNWYLVAEYVKLKKKYH